MTTNRMDRWRDASLQSFWLENNMNELLWLLQMLGREDVALYEYEQLLNADWSNISAGRPIQAVDDLLPGMVWRAYTWVLASYELIRTVSERLQAAAPQVEISARARELKNEFARLRIPFAKFEPAKKYKQSDFCFPLGCMQPDRGLCWQVADGVVVSRMELANRLLDFLIALKGYRAGLNKRGV